MVVITDGMMNEDEDRRREERGTSSRRCGAEGLVLKAMQSARLFKQKQLSCMLQLCLAFNRTRRNRCFHLQKHVVDWR